MAQGATPHAVSVAGRVVVPAAILLVVLLASPLLPVVIASTGRAWFFPALLPMPDGSAWRAVLDPASGIAAAAGCSLAVAGLAALVGLAVAVPAALALARRRLPARSWVILLLAAPAVVPSLAVAMGLHALFLKTGLAGTTVGVAIVHLMPVLPYQLLVLVGLFTRLDPGYAAAARTLGAGRVALLRHVTVPMLAPGLAAAFAFGFVVSWSQYGLTLLIGGGRVTTLPMLLAQFAGSGRLDLAGVAAVLTVVPSLAVFAIAARHLLPVPSERPAR